MNFTLCRVNVVLKKEGLIISTPRTDGIFTIKRLSDGKVVAAIHPITRKFWVKKRNKNGVNGDFEMKNSPITTFNDLIVWGQEALIY